MISMFKAHNFNKRPIRFKGETLYFQEVLTELSPASKLTCTSLFIISIWVVMNFSTTMIYSYFESVISSTFLAAGNFQLKKTQYKWMACLGGFFSDTLCPKIHDF